MPAPAVALCRILFAVLTESAFRPAGSALHDKSDGKHDTGVPFGGTYCAAAAIPMHGPPNPYQPVVHSPRVEEMLDQWVSAKRARNFPSAERLFQELHSCGVDPETSRPRYRPRPRYSGTGPTIYSAARSLNSKGSCLILGRMMGLGLQQHATQRTDKYIRSDL